MLYPIAVAAITDSFSDILSLAITGIIVVLFGLLLLSFLVSLIKKLTDAVEGKNKSEKTQVPEIEIATSESTKLDLNEDQIHAIITALMIEWKLYHEEELTELTYAYKPEPIADWVLSSYTNN